MNKTETAIVDGLGRLTQTQLTSDPDGATYTQTQYNGLGRKYKVYNRTRCNPPTSNCGESTWGYTTYQYDALGRTTSVTEQDGSVVSTDYSLFPCVTVTDESGKARKSCSDGLDRLTSVTEDPSGLDYATSYSYDALDDLTSVVQSVSRNRTFVYDSLSRLTSSTNPESNWSNGDQVYVPTTYAYDADGNLINKTEPAQNQQGTATVTLTYCYDALNRLTAKGYTAQSCSNGIMPGPIATYSYDQSSCLGQSACHNIGRRTGMIDQAGSEAWAYDLMGRAIVDARVTNEQTKVIPYTYNFDGSIASLSVPTYADDSHPYTVTYIPGGAGRPIQLANNTWTNAVDELHYTPSGAECYQRDNLDGTLYRSATFNSRLQLATTGSVSRGVPEPPPCTVMPVYYPHALVQPTNLAYNYVDANGHNNGDVQSITNNKYGQGSRSQVFTYDSLNRLSSASTTSTHATSPGNCWGENYTYDAWGNLLSIAPMTGSYTGCGQESGISPAATAQNQISGYSYDTAGNLIVAPGGGTYSYDAENHLISAGGVTYTYDGDGKRVEKSNGTIYWYGLNSSPLIETDLSNNIKVAYFFLNGQRIVRSAGVNYFEWYFADALGNARYVWQPDNLAPDESDYYPFGGERVLNSGVGNHYKFTGKERDPESDLDNFGARYYSSQMGRFMSPDPLGGHLENPQSLNKYAYALNNPLTNTDPTGLDSYLQCQKASTTCSSETVGYDSKGNAQKTLVQGVTNADKSFTATLIGNKNADGSGGLVDKTTGTGSYTASVNGSGVQFSNDGGKTSSTGVFDNGTPQTKFSDAGFANGGALSGFNFTLNNSKLEANQTEAGSFSFNGTSAQAGAALQHAGFDPHWGTEGGNEYRSRPEWELRSNL